VIILTPKIQNQENAQTKAGCCGKDNNCGAPAVTEAKKINSMLACLTWSRTLLECGGFSTLCFEMTASFCQSSFDTSRPSGQVAKGDFFFREVFFFHSPPYFKI
jgi:hypothetical protein